MEEKEKRELVYRITTEIVARNTFSEEYLKRGFKKVFRSIEEAVNELEDEEVKK